MQKIGRLLMIGTRVPETCRGYNKVLKDFKTVVHLIGFIYCCHSSKFFALRGRKISEILVITIRLYFLAQICFAKRKFCYTPYFNSTSVPFRSESSLTFKIILCNSM
jgi:hypothetical protein